MYASLQIYAGITSSGGFETDDDPMHVSMIQMVISKCLEKEVLCNEFYLQLVKQTTDQPGDQYFISDLCISLLNNCLFMTNPLDPNSRINIQNWRFMALTCGVVVPRSKVIISTFDSHIRTCYRGTFQQDLVGYLMAHLHRCSLDTMTEEGQWAQYCIQVSSPINKPCQIVFLKQSIL